jgi:uncharacterized membrane protein
LNKIKEFWLQSYRNDKVAFMFELVSFVFTVGASMYLAVNALQPDMRYVYPGFLIGAACGAYGYYRRGLPWPLLLTSYFVIVNIAGLGVAMQWW